MPINQFNDYPWQRRDATIGSDRYERELDRRVNYRDQDPTLVLQEDDGYREWIETIERQEEQNES